MTLSIRQWHQWARSKTSKSWARTFAALDRVHRAAKARLAPFQSYLLSTGKRRDYVILAAVGLAPIVLSMAIGVFESRRLTDNGPIFAGTDFEQEVARANGLASAVNEVAQGFGDRWNWMTYPALLPVALWLLRRAARRILGTQSVAAFGGSLAPLQQRASSYREDGALLLYALLISGLIEIIDLMEGTWRYVSWFWLGEPTTCSIQNLDWGWFGFAFRDVSLWKVAALQATTYLEQFMVITIVALFSMMTLLFNRGYVDVVFRRSRDSGTPGGETIELDFGDGNGLFGLGKLHPAFDIQVKFLSIIGSLMLLSRFMNVDSAEIIDCPAALWRFITDFPGRLELPLDRLFPDAGQLMIVVGWIVMCRIVLIPASVKLIPFKQYSRQCDRDAFLRELVRPGSRLDMESTKELAEKFSANCFWPIGDQYAAWLFTAAFFVLFVLIFPIRPWAVEGAWWVYLTIFALSVLSSGGYLWWQAKRLARIGL